ncbi:hypothetical protein JB92DRAFT_2942250 [Gautieria morchelliformis]|nr:hypothetical protein JB92DRAFT_2942250 [Gautieria morchelliformis]
MCTNCPCIKPVQCFLSTPTRCMVRNRYLAGRRERPAGSCWQLAGARSSSQAGQEVNGTHLRRL